MGWNWLPARNMYGRPNSASCSSPFWCAWTSTFGAIWAVAISHDGQYRAAGSRRGEMWVWAGPRLHLMWRAHSDVVRALAFSPDGRHLASGSYDGTVKVWEVESGALRW